MKVVHSPRKDRARLRTCDSGSTMKTKIASFNGQQFVAERDGDELHIFMIHADPIDTMTMGAQDRRPIRTAADINAINREFYKQGTRNG
jgi:hypothetical protein